MSEQDIIIKLEAIFRETLDNPGISLKDTTSATDIAEWDSVTHLILLHAIEESFRLQFTLEEVMEFQQIGDIKQSIASKLGYHI